MRSRGAGGFLLVAGGTGVAMLLLPAPQPVAAGVAWVLGLLGAAWTRSEAGSHTTPERPRPDADVAGIREPGTDGVDQRLDAAMIRETPNGLLLLDREGRIRRMNPAARRMLPIRGEPRGLAPIECIPLPALQEVVDDVLHARAPSERGVQVDGMDLLVRAIPLAEDSGVMAIVLDVSSVRAAERARRDFVANVSHELRTPVTAILGWSEALAGDRETLPESARPMVAAIDRNARRLGRLIEDVLALSRLEARRADLPLRTMPLAPLVEEVLLRHASLAASQGVVLHAQVPDALEARVDAAAFEHALGNLVDNALKHTPSGGTVRVEARMEEDLVRIDVVDTGVGIAEVHHARIFERFYRVDTGRDRAVGGTGLGLALVKHLCHAMHADVSVASAPGEGSTFTIRIRASSS